MLLSRAPQAVPLECRHSVEDRAAGAPLPGITIDDAPSSAVTPHASDLRLPLSPDKAIPNAARSHAGNAQPE